MALDGLYCTDVPQETTYIVNDLLADVTTAESLSTFCQRLKTHLFSKTFLRPRSYDKTGLRPASVLVLVLYFWSWSWSWSWSCSFGLGLSLGLILLVLLKTLLCPTGAV